MGKYSKVLITGASGFVAKNLRLYLSQKNTNLVSISRNDFQGFKHECKIISKYDEKLLPHIQDADVLVHLVGIGRQSVDASYDEINDRLTRQITTLCTKTNIKKIIYLSGLGVSHNTSSGYFISKYNAEQHIINSGLDYVIFRPSYILSRDDSLTKHLQQQIKNKEIRIPGSGKYLLQPIHMTDVLEVIYAAIYQNKFKNMIIDLVGPDCITFEQYARLCSQGTDTTITKTSLEDAYYDAITNPDSILGPDDLNLLIGSFVGDHQKLRKISGINFYSILQSGRLP